MKSELPAVEDVYFVSKHALKLDLRNVLQCSLSYGCTLVVLMKENKGQPNSLVHMSIFGQLLSKTSTYATSFVMVSSEMVVLPEQNQLFFKNLKTQEVFEKYLKIEETCRFIELFLLRESNLLGVINYDQQKILIRCIPFEHIEKRPQSTGKLLIFSHNSFNSYIIQQQHKDWSPLMNFQLHWAQLQLREDQLLGIFPFSNTVKCKRARQKIQMQDQTQLAVNDKPLTNWLFKFYEDKKQRNIKMVSKFSELKNIIEQLYSNVFYQGRWDKISLVLDGKTQDAMTLSKFFIFKLKSDQNWQDEIVFMSLWGDFLQIVFKERSHLNNFYIDLTCNSIMTTETIAYEDQYDMALCKIFKPDWTKSATVYLLPSKNKKWSSYCLVKIIYEVCPQGNKFIYIFCWQSMRTSMTICCKTPCSHWE